LGKSVHVPQYRRGGEEMTTDAKYFSSTQPDVFTPGEAKNMQKERRMVRVIIQHKSDDLEGLVDLLKEIRDEVMKFPGYITSEHLINADDPTSLVVVSTWQNTDRWHNWENSEICKNLMARLNAKLKEPLKITLYNYFVIREKRVWSTW
jgi:quinol monooxygenase YgiN